MVHIANKIRVKSGVYLVEVLFLHFNFLQLVSVTAGGPKSGPRAKIYGLLRLIHSVWRASSFPCLKIH